MDRRLPGIFGLVGNLIDNTLGSVIKYLFFSNSEMSSGDYGTGLGCFIGAWLAVPSVSFLVRLVRLLLQLLAWPATYSLYLLISVEP